jgi:hypothetical protein
MVVVVGAVVVVVGAVVAVVAGNARVGMSNDASCVLGA